MFELSAFRFGCWSAAVVVSIGLFLGGCAQTPSANVRAGRGHFSTVLIDPGHGGKDSGGVSANAERKCASRPWAFLDRSD
jgi:hypothetical protein